MYVMDEYGEVRVREIDEIDETFEKAYPWDPDMPKGWRYREGINRNGKRYRGYFPPPFDDDTPIWLQAYPPYGDPEVLAEKRRQSLESSRNGNGWGRRGSGDPSTDDIWAAGFFGIPNTR